MDASSQRQHNEESGEPLCEFIEPLGPPCLTRASGADGWAMTPSGTRGVLNDAISIYFADATLASAFVARWCVRAKVETAGGVFQVREDEPEPRVGAGLRRTP